MTESEIRRYMDKCEEAMEYVEMQDLCRDALSELLASKAEVERLRKVLVRIRTGCAFPDDSVQKAICTVIDEALSKSGEERK